MSNKSSFATTSGDDDSLARSKKARAARSTNTTPRATSKKSQSANGAGADKVFAGRVSKKKDTTGAVVNGIQEEVPSTEQSMHEFMDMGIDVESVVEELRLDTSGYEEHLGF